MEVREAVPGQTESLLADETINFTFENTRRHGTCRGLEPRQLVRER